MTAPVSDEIAGALGAFFHGGSGPSHATITGVLLRTGYSEGDGYVAGRMDNPNKEQRVQSAVRRAIRRPDRARDLTEGMLTQLRLHGCFQAQSTFVSQVDTLRSALRRSGYSISEDGTLLTLGAIDLRTGNRSAGPLRSAPAQSCCAQPTQNPHADPSAESRRSVPSAKGARCWRERGRRRPGSWEGVSS